MKLNSYACTNQNTKQKYLKPNIMRLLAFFSVCRQFRIISAPQVSTPGRSRIR